MSPATPARGHVADAASPVKENGIHISPSGSDSMIEDNKSWTDSECDLHDTDSTDSSIFDDDDNEQDRGDIDPAELPVLGEPKGACDHCKKRPAKFRCYDCCTGQFCRDWCFELGRGKGTHVCPPTMREKTSADDLIDAVAVDKAPGVQAAWDDFYLSDCPSATDQSRLLGVYKTLCIDLGVNKVQLYQWKLAKKIHDNAARMFKRNKSKVPHLYYCWLDKRGHCIFVKEGPTEKLVSSGLICEALGF